MGSVNDSIMACVTDMGTVYDVMRLTVCVSVRLSDSEVHSFVSVVLLVGRVLPSSSLNDNDVLRFFYFFLFFKGIKNFQFNSAFLLIFVYLFSALLFRFSHWFSAVLSLECGP